MKIKRHLPLAIALLGVATTQARAQSIYTPYAFTNFAGLPGVPGTNDGPVATARFTGGNTVAVDTLGNVYVTDGQPYSTTLRKITPAGEVTTLAGTAGVIGSNDGIGSAARFWNLRGVAVDRVGNAYVADLYNCTVRKITPDAVVTTLAGTAGQGGSVDGIGGAARFSWPHAVAIDTNDNIYVTDTWNHTIRKITPGETGWVVTTLAGSAGQSGSVDGTNSSARFDRPTSVAVDSAGNVYVTDTYNHTIRKITPSRTDWVVTTLAGLAGTTGSADGTGGAARFNHPVEVAVDSLANVYVTDGNNHTIRKITPAGAVTTLAGLAGTAGSEDGSGITARFTNPGGVAVDNAGVLYVGDNARITKGTPVWDPTSINLEIKMYSGLTIYGAVGSYYRIDYVNDLNNTNWLPLTQLRLPYNPYLFIDTDSPTNHPKRFYRAVLVP